MTEDATRVSEPVESDAQPPRPTDILAVARRHLEASRQRAEGDVFANPIRSLATALAKELDTRPTAEADIDTLIRRLTAHAFVARAERLRAYLGEVDPAENEARLRRLIARLGHDEDGAPVPFEAFRARVERVYYGFVVTAHPTFSLAVDLLSDLAALALERDPQGRPLEPARRQALLARIEAVPHRPALELTLAQEFEQSVTALLSLKAALRRVHRVVREVAQDLHPARWTELRPRLVTMASWVGYDMDGRSDIAWTANLAYRLRIEERQLAAYVERIGAIRAQLPAEHALVAALELIGARLALSLRAVEEQAEAFAHADPGDDAWREHLARLSRNLKTTRATQYRDGRELAQAVGRAVELAADLPEIQAALWELGAEIGVCGLGLARSHVRINAVQLHNAIRKTIGMEHAPDDPSHRASYLAAIAQLIREVRPETIHYGSIAEEKATAKRVFMTIAQMLKVIDAAEPIRFLIAETETPFTLLTALYFAKLFGVDDRVDISPLFETRKALERGVAVLEGALEVEEYRAYLRRRGRVCVQTGFSDAGRYLGQIAASIAIERIRLGLAGLLARHGLGDLELIIFDTHGESIGRGAHPESFADRLAYYDTAESRRRFAAAGIRLRQETSYQGGDGYLPIMTETGAFAVLTRVLEHTLTEPSAEPDPFYDERDAVDEFAAAIRAFNHEVIESPAYATFLGAFGPNLLYPTGSRALKRQHDGASGRVALEHPSQLRAIPHNAVLQQMGVLANTIGGLGRAVDKDPERFHRLYHESPRFRRLMRMVEHAFKFTDLRVTEAYLALFDPASWLDRAQSIEEAHAAEELRAVADMIERLDLHDRLQRILRVMRRDYMDLARALREHRRRTRETGEQPIAVDPLTRDTLHLLHALRIALIDRLFRKAIRVPDFSDRHQVNRESVVARLMQLDVEPALALLGTIFPITEGRQREQDWGEVASYRSAESQSYVQEHEQIFRPIARHYDWIRRISTGVVHQIGALG
jgi:phosphoenolpyruvate carboxylase